MAARAGVGDPQPVPLIDRLRGVPGGRFGAPWRPSLRMLVLLGSSVVIVIIAIAIAFRTSDQLRATATEAALGNAESIVRGYVDPILGADSLGLEAAPDPAVMSQLELLVAAGEMRRINVFTRDGRVLYTTEPSLAGARVAIDASLAKAFSGTSDSAFGSGADANGPEVVGRRLPADYLETYVPIRGTTDGNPIGVFEVYFDAGPIETAVGETRRDVFLITLLGGVGLLALLWLAFAAASQRLAAQNRRLAGLNTQLHARAGDLLQSEARFRSLVQNSSDVVVVLDRAGIVTYQSDAVRGVLGQDAEALRGAAFDRQLHPEDVGWVRALLKGDVAAMTRQQRAQVRMRHADGGWRWVEAIAQDRWHDPAVGGLVLNFRDVTDQKRLEDQLQHEAFHDPLTGLANRALFTDRVTHALTRASRGPVDSLGVIFADLDDFKVVNDSLGHVAGDELLTSVGERILGCLRRQDTAARLGGDEFAILLEDADSEVAAEVADRVLDALRHPFTLSGRQVFVQASLGMALGGGIGSRQSADELLRNADAAMYTAKSRGKGRHEFYAPVMHESALHRLELRSRLEQALENRELVVHYQPIVDLGTRSIAGVEALVRWQQPNGRLALPAEFIPLAEETGLVVPLGQAVLDEACRTARRWQDGPPGTFTLAVNVASRQLQDPGFAASLAATIQRSGIRPADLVVEVTESALLDDGDVTNASIASIKALGVRIALDDFGTGYSSLSHLRRFPIDILKIDRSFVDEIDSVIPGERALVQSILRLAISLELETVAEGVERAEQAIRLRALGAQYAQGYHFAAPLPADALSELLIGWERLAG